MSESKRYMFGFVYLTTNNINGKKYIGQRKYHWDNPRSDERYLGSGKLLKQAIRKHGRACFSRTIIQECSSQEELNECERKWIAHYDAVTSKEFYNIASGGCAGDIWSCQSKYKRLKFKKRISESNRTRKRNTSRISGKKNPAFGRHWYKDVKHHQQYYLHDGDPLISSLGLVRGMFRTKKHNQKISESNRGRKKNYTVHAKGKIAMSRDGIVRFVDPSELDKFMSNGYVKGNCRTSIRKRVCVNNGSVNKMVEKRHLNHYIQLGWVLGRICV